MYLRHKKRPPKCPNKAVALPTLVSEPEVNSTNQFPPKVIDHKVIEYLNTIADEDFFADLPDERPPPPCLDGNVSVHEDDIFVVSHNESYMYDDALPEGNSRSESVYSSDEHDLPEERTVDVHGKHEEESVEEKLLNWAIDFNLSDCAVTALFRILHMADVAVPTDVRTTHRKFGSGEKFESKSDDVAYVGVRRALKEQVQVRPQNFVRLHQDHKSLVLNFNCDGLPIARYSHQQFWPVLMVTNACPDHVSVVAVYWGREKPTAEKLLGEVVDELDEILQHGFDIALNRKRSLGDDKAPTSVTLPVKLGYFVADIPAMALVKQTPQHTGFYCCIKCNIKGVTPVDRNLRSFVPQVTDRKRTDSSFRAQLQASHHVGVSPFTRLDTDKVDMVKNFVIDNMHTTDLGVCKRQADYWTGNYKLKSDADGPIKEGDPFDGDTELEEPRAA